MPDLSTERGGDIEIISPRGVPARRQTTISLVAAEEESESNIDIPRLLRRYAWLLLLFLLLGLLGGFVSIILATPMYRSHLLMDIQPTRSTERRTVEAEDMLLQTQMMMIRSSGFLRRVAERIQSEALPVAPVRNNFFTKLRTKLRPEMRNSAQLMSDGVLLASQNLQVRPVNGTTLIEISCESSHPDIAASFANTVAAEFIDQNMLTRSGDAQRTGQWLAAQVEETKSKLKEAEDKLQEYIRSSGNLFAGQEVTLADSTLRQFQGDMASAKSARIALESKYRAIFQATPEKAGELLEDPGIRLLQTKLDALRQERTLLSMRFTGNHYKVQQIDTQIRETEQLIKRDVAQAVERIKNEYDGAIRRERLLGSAYSGAAGQVTAQAGQAAQYAALKREVDILRQTYSQILMQASQTSINNALPQSNIRVVDTALPATEPLRPKPAMNLAFGGLFGLVLSGGIIFLRERMDRSVKHPGSARELLNVRELGVIPMLAESEVPSKAIRVRIALKNGHLWRKVFPQGQAAAVNDTPELIGWQQRTFLSESFRHTVASLLREDETGFAPSVAMITSPNPSEGKTMVTANLGISLAETGRRVLLIDADFRRPRLHSIFRLTNGQGVSNLLEQIRVEGKCEEAAVIQTTKIPGLSVLANGSDFDNLPQLLYAGYFRLLLDKLRSQYDMILIDAAPVLQIVDARILHQLVDGVVLVLRSGKTDRKSALEAYRYLREDGAPLLGTILNDWRPKKSNVARYYNYVRSTASHSTSLKHPASDS